MSESFVFKGDAGTDVELEWGLKMRFVDYVSRLPDGVVQAAGGALRDGAVFRFPGKLLLSGRYTFSGTIHFFGDAGVLNVTLDEICIESGLVTAAAFGVRIPIARTGAGDESVSGKCVFNDVALTADGAAMLGGVYDSGAPADPMVIRQ